MGFKIFATEGTHKFFTEEGLKSELVYKVSEGKSPTLVDAMSSGKCDLIINIPSSYSRSSVTDGYQIRRKSVDLNIPLITNVQVGRMIAEALKMYGVDDLKIKSVDKYFS